MSKKKNKKNEATYSIDSLTFKSDNYIILGDSTEWVTNTITTSSTTVDYSFDSSANFSFTDSIYVTSADPFAELEKFQNDLEEDERLRNENPSLQDAHEQYQLIKKLVQDEECDKFFDDKMRTFRV